MRYALSLLLASLLLVLGCTDNKPSSAPSVAGDGPPIELKTTTVKDLEAAISAQKGKVVVVDVWATWCPPCRKEFHNLVELHQVKARDGVVCMSVAVSSPSEEARKFLQDQKATFTNYRLDKEESDKLAETWHYKFIPAVFVYDRDGKQIPFINDDTKSFDYSDVNKKVDELLAKK